MPPLVDSHTHLDHYEPAEIPGILQRAAEADVRLMICAGTTLVSTRNSVALANEYRPIYAGVGFHPADLQGPITNAIYDEFKSLAENNPKVVCVSEIGLDFLPTSPDREIQLQAFRAQIRLALELKKPIVFHSRESHPEVLQTLREEGADAVGGIMHYFQGDEATADGTLDGTNGADLVMRHIDAEAAIMVGDPVVTSSLGGSLPRGIPVGRIVAIEVSPTSVLRQAIVEPLVQPERLDVVQVILGQTAGA